MHELRPARCELDHPTHAALAGADVIVADDKALALQLSGRINFDIENVYSRRRQSRASPINLLAT